MLWQVKFMVEKRAGKNPIELRPVEEKELAQIHKYHNGECREELSDFLDSELLWAPMTLEQMKNKIAEMTKRERTVLSALYAQKAEFVGLAFFSAGWDTWSPHIHVIIWPKHRQKGYGRAAAQKLLDNCFGNTIAHSVGAGVSDWCEPGIHLAKSLGFSEVGKMRRTGVREGKFSDSIMFNILRSEYLGKRRKAR